MGCIYPSTSLSSYQKELKSELITNRKILLSKSKKSFDSVTFQAIKENLNLNSTQNVRNFKTNSNIKKSSTTKDILLKQNNSKNFIPRLSLQKINELFDNSNIESYYAKPKNLKNSLYKEENNSKINNKFEISLNTTFEHTLENSLVNEYNKSNSITSNKKKYKKTFLNCKLK